MTCCSGVCEAAGRQFGEKRAAADLERYRAKGPGKTARMLLAGIEAAGARRLPRDTSSAAVLDVGTGVGAIVFELLKSGAASAIAIDMSEDYIAAAAKEASRQDLSAAIRFVHGDFVAVAPQLGPADLVTLDRVVCCYPDDRALIDESLRHARYSIALSYPRDAWYVKLVISVENLVRRVRGNPFRTFVHSTAAMQRRIEDAGFRLTSRTSTVAWRADVYINARKDDR
jgi:2-polyprenyl-3-methyl-5-hydroxy-6-metoxy-1,4-benzoquinol methylase